MIEAGLKQAGGKCIINSANLEDGEEKFAQMCALARRYGAGLVAGHHRRRPEEAMARTADRKVAIARRMHELATEKYGLEAEDIIFDPLVLPISTGMEEDRRNALETIEGTRRIAEKFPNVPDHLRPVQRQLRPQARGAAGAQQRLPARAARGGPDQRDRPCLQDPAAQQDRR